MDAVPQQTQVWLGRLTAAGGGKKLVGFIEDYAGWRIKLEAQLGPDGTFSVFGELLEREPMR